MSDVRLRYTTLVNYTAAILKVIMLTLSAVIVTRKLKPEEYALWGLVLSLSGVFISPSQLWRGWSARYARRGYSQAYSTGLFLTLIWLAIALLIYSILSGVYGHMLGGLSAYYLLLASPYIAIYILYTFYLSLSNATAPVYSGYSDLTMGFVKLLLTYALVLVLRMRLEGVILASTLALIAGILIIVIGLKKNGIKIKGINFRLAKAWFRGFPNPLLRTINTYMINADRSLLPLIVQSEIPLAYLTAAYTAKLPLQGGFKITAGLYSRFLRRKRGLDVEETLRLILLPSTFILFTILAIPATLMSVLRPEYVEAYPVFMLAAAFAYINLLHNIFLTTIQAADTVDARIDFSLKDLFLSDLFKSTAVNTFRNVAALIFSLLLLATFPHMDYVFIAAVFPLSWLITTIASIVWMYLKAGKVIKFKFPLKDYISFLIAGAVTYIYYIACDVHEIIVASFWQDIPQLILHTVIAAAVYLAVTLLLSKWTRNLLFAIFKKIVEFL